MGNRVVNDVSNSTIRNPNSPLPAGWRWVGLGEVIEDTQPGFACGKRAGDDGVIQLRMNNISIRGQIDLSSIIRIPATPEQIKKYRLLPGDIVFNNTNSVELVGKTALFYEEKGVFLYSNHLTRLRPKIEILTPVYLTLWLQLHWRQRLFEHICDRWIGQAAVHLEKLLALEFLLPPLPEQKRIAAKVEELMAEVERARTACEKRLEAAKVLPSSYLRQVFESEEARKWERRGLGEVCDICQYGLTMVATDKGAYPYVRITDFDDLGNIKIYSMRFVVCDENTYERYALKEGDILFARSSSVGRTFLYSGIPPKAIFASYLIRFRLNQEIIDPLWVFYFTHSQHYYEFIKQKTHTVSQPNINAQEYKSLSILYPPLPTQQRLAAELKDKMAYAEKLKASIEKQLDVIKALPQAILKKAFSGEL